MTAPSEPSDSPGLSDNELLDMIKAEAEALVPDLDVRRLDLDAHIADAGISSVQMLELVARLEQRLRVTLPDHELTAVESVSDLLRVIAAEQAEVP